LGRLTFAGRAAANDQANSLSVDASKANMQLRLTLSAAQ
jgi:hypothetical protein